MHQQSGALQPQGQMNHQNGVQRPAIEGPPASGQPVLYLLSLNGTFERKTISVPFYPDTLRIGRQTNAKTVPTPVNGFFDSKVLSRQHAEIWADRNGKVWIRDIKSSNGTFVNGTRLSPENRESEPHELQTQDHLELGIDIVSEDQKTVVHHKVAAKVEHAGPASPASNIMDMGFSDLDPTNNGMMPMANGPFRGRAPSQASVNGRMVPNAGAVAIQANPAAHQRQFWLNPITTEHIVKRLHNEMRSARLQNQDLTRTGQFLNALLSKDDVKNHDKPEGVEAPKSHMTNGNGMSFRSDGGKTRFSDPPAPPPSQPLPEKPDIPSLKRLATEKPKSQTIPQENVQQILQLTEALQNAKKEIDNHSARVRELEEMFKQEREARLVAEELARKVEESHTAQYNGSAGPGQLPGSLEKEIENAFDLPTERPVTPEPGTDADKSAQINPPHSDALEAAAAMFQSRIDSMVTEMMGLREQLELFRTRAEKAETERDEDRKTLAEMVAQIRRRDEEEQQRAAERRSRSHTRSRADSRGPNTPYTKEAILTTNGHALAPTDKGADDISAGEETEVPASSRGNSAAPPATTELGNKHGAEPALMAQSLPYASMIGVVLLGMGLMAYMNGWQAPPPRLDH